MKAGLSLRGRASEAVGRLRGSWQELIEEVREERASAREEPTPSRELIKGNQTARGELIYHVPGGQFYDAVQAEATFATEEEARAAGYRKSMR
jgi:hypothetical protein